MTKIIGHRGAAGLALENSRESILAALAHDVDAVEFDVHLTKDNHIVVIHDHHTGRIAKQRASIHKLTLSEIKQLELKNGQQIPTLDEVLDILGTKPVVIDVKDNGSADEILNILDRHPAADVTVVSFKHQVLKALRTARPDLTIYVLEHFSPIEIIHSARHLKAQGIALNMWLMNPLTYKLCKRYGLQLYVYTVNSLLIGRLFKKLYPDVIICTDHPERFITERDPVRQAGT